jgi:hypothetical protein
MPDASLMATVEGGIGTRDEVRDAMLEEPTGVLDATIEGDAGHAATDIDKDAGASKLRADAAVAPVPDAGSGATGKIVADVAAQPPAAMDEADADSGVSAPTTRDTYHDGTSKLDGLPETTCTISVTSAVSPAIPTVGIVTFDTTMVDVVAAEIHFGLDQDYGLVAPVVLTDRDHRTLLLGMIENSTYHYRVAVSDGASVCRGEDRTLQTGSLGTAALSQVSTSDAAAPGFIVTARDGEAVIYDKQGRLVWAYDMPYVFSVHMSWDGQYMIGRDTGPFDEGVGGVFLRVKMDGSEAIDMDAPGGDHHDFTPIPEGIAYLGKQDKGECDRVYEASIAITDGVPVFDTWQIYQYFPDGGEVEGTEICHANRIRYYHDDGTYSVSDRNKDAIAVFTKHGAPVVSIGKEPTGGWTRHIRAQGAGPGGDWHVQHGHHLYADDKLVVFSNESSGGSAMLHYTLGADSAVLDWKFAGAGDSRIGGDVQRLPNGNFLVTSNLSGTIVEVGPSGQSEVGRYVLGGAIGPSYGFSYSTHRATLYGSPPPR